MTTTYINMFGLKWVLLNILCISGCIAYNCGYKSCHQINYTDLNVHIVPHSHDDVGWTSTVADYYANEVEFILDTVLDALKKNPNRKFIQVETAFFHQWWEKLPARSKQDYKNLVNNGKLEIIGGAWSMNDEATAHYQSIIDQFTLGLRVINDTLGPCGRPKIGWQIDPFGHSREMASIFAQLGYDGLFFGRLDYRDKEERLKTKTAEMMWQGNSKLGNNSNIFTSILYNLYQPPDGFCFDSKCSDEINSSNREDKIKEFAEFVSDQAKDYATNNILITMGGDFTYTSAGSYFKQIDYLIDSFNNANLKTSDGKRIMLFYSTPSCYVKAVNEMTLNDNLHLKLKTDDFFPYADNSNSYWTGFYTSRPTSKRYERQGNNLLQVSKQLSTFIKPSTDFNVALFPLQKSMGVFQHHDAITGTEKQHVAFDYADMLTNSMQKSILYGSERILKLLSKKEMNGDFNIEFDSCLLSNISICHKTNGDFLVYVYNPLAHSVDYHVKLPVDSIGFTITTQGEEVPYQMSEKIKSFTTSNLLDSFKKYDLTFLAKSIPPLGAKSYYVYKSDEVVNIEASENTGKGIQYLGAKSTGFTIDNNGYLSSITLNNKTINVSQSLMYYVSHIGSNYGTDRSSGAYSFSPEGEAKHFEDKLNFTVYKGDLFDEIHQEYSSWAKQIIRVYKQTDSIEFDYIVGPLSTNEYGTEVISRFDTELDSGDIFFTDTNGRDTIQRTRNTRDTYPFKVDSEISSNYYPVVSKIMIEDTKKNVYFSVLNDRSQGGSSLKSGQIELMLHRRTVRDDSWGVDESLNEKEFHFGMIARIQHYISLGSIDNNNDHLLSREKLLQPWVYISDITEVEEEFLQDYQNYEFSGLKSEFPKNIHLLSLEPWRVNENQILIRLENINSNSNVTTINLKDKFKYFNIKSLREMTLGANQFLNENKKFGWRIGEYLNSKNNQKPTTYKKLSKIDGFNITLGPMQIRTFIAKVEYAHSWKINTTEIKNTNNQVRILNTNSPMLENKTKDESILGWFSKSVAWIKGIFE